MTWVYVDDKKRVLASCPDSMEGNTGWQSVSNAAPDALFTEDGVPKYKVSAGKVKARTAAEMAADVPAQENTPPAPTVEERLDEIDLAIVELAALLGGGEE